MDNDYITESDIDPREENGYIVTDSDLLSYDEWWREHNANFCCKRPSHMCACGGYTDQLPSGASRFLKKEEDT